MLEKLERESHREGEGYKPISNPDVFHPARVEFLCRHYKPSFRVGLSIGSDDDTILDYLAEEDVFTAKD